MKFRSIQFVRVALWLLAAVGVFLVIAGGWSGVRPHFQLDQVLTPAELRDAATRERTLALMQRASGSDGTVLVVSGIAIVAISLVALTAIDRPYWEEGSGK